MSGYHKPFPDLNRTVFSFPAIVIECRHEVTAGEHLNSPSTSCISRAALRGFLCIGGLNHILLLRKFGNLDVVWLQQASRGMIHLSDGNLIGNLSL